MTLPPSSSLNQALQIVRALDIPLGEKLGYIADQVRALSPQFSDAIDVFVGRLEQARAGSLAPQIGELMPSFMLPDDQGRLISLETLLQTAPVIVTFHRGHWCPFCQTNTIGLAEIENEIQPIQIVAISPEMQAYSRKLKAETGANFPFLTDMGNGYATSLNLAIWVDDDMASLISGSGLDIPKYQGQEGWILPIPSVFVVGQDGVIQARHIDPDYRRRLELSDLKVAAKAALS
jgi:peroxiredoxin